MLVNKDQVVRQTGDFEYYSCEKFEVYFQGLVYFAGSKEGKDSVIKLLESWKHEIPKAAIQKLRGNFLMTVYSKELKQTYTFTDNSGLYKAYYTDTTVCSSFLELVGFEKLTADDLDPGAVVEYLKYGFVYHDNTLLSSIKKIKNNKILGFDEQGQVKQYDKELNSIFNNQPVDPLQGVKDLIHATKGKKISIDATGGIDSRLLIALFNYYEADFELAISGPKGFAEIAIAEKVAKTVDKELNVTYHTTKDLTVAELKEIFKISDAQLDIIGFHRNYHLYKQRAQRGVDLHLSGAGGELYKDFWWLQDFPFYNSKKPNVEQLYKLRIDSAKFQDGILAPSYQKEMEKLKSKTLKSFDPLRRTINTEYYDNIYFNYKMQTNAGYHLKTGMHFMKSFSPLLEYDMVSYGVQLPRRQRFYNNFHRELVSKTHKELSKIKTSEGISCSASLSDKIIDLIGFSLDKGKKIAKVLRGNFLPTNAPKVQANHSEIYEQIIGTHEYKNALELLKEQGILCNSVSTETIKSMYAGKLLTLAFLCEQIER